MSANERPVKKARIDTKPIKGALKKSKADNARTQVDAEAAQPLKAKAKIEKGKGKAKNEPPPLPRSFKIIAGSYEKLLYGLEGTLSLSEDDEGGHGYTIAINPTFIFPAHVSCIKAVAASPHGGKWLATGSADEIIKVWDLRRKKEVGGLMHHEGSITHLSFPSRTHLLSASEDGTLALFRARDWAVLRTLRGHKGRVNSVAVHPSAKLALSVGKDRTLRMWDLMRGKGSASTRLGKEGEMVRWNVGGKVFAVQAGSKIDIYSTSMQLLHTITHPSRLHDILFTVHPHSSEDLLFAGGEDGKLTIYALPEYSQPDEDIPAPRVVAHMAGHANRVKAVDILSVALPGVGNAKATLVCTASSDGKIRVFDLADLPKEGVEVKEIEPRTVYDSKGTRLTCVAFADGDLGVDEMGVGVKRGRDEEEGESSDEGDGEWGGVEREEEAEVDAEDESDESDDA